MGPVADARAGAAAAHRRRPSSRTAGDRRAHVVTAQQGGEAGSWQQRLEDPAAPLFTMAVVAEVLGVDQQVIRRLDVDGIMSTARPSGNQRRYSRDDIAVIAYAVSLQADGVSRPGIARILELERDLSLLGRDRGSTRSAMAGADVTRTQTGRCARCWKRSTFAARAPRRRPCTR